MARIEEMEAEEMYDVEVLAGVRKRTPFVVPIDDRFERYLDERTNAVLYRRVHNSPQRNLDGGRNGVVKVEDGDIDAGERATLDFAQAQVQVSQALSPTAAPGAGAGPASSSSKPPSSASRPPNSSSSSSHSHSATDNNGDGNTSAGAAAATNANNTGTTNTTTTTTAAPTSQKPKSSRAARQPSPSPPPPPPPPPERKTIRLDIRLGGPENYSVDISALAKETGQRPPTPPPVKRDTSESEGEEEDGKKAEGEGEGAGGAGKGGKNSKRKKNLQSEYYDLNDPFIDDSDLAVDERQYIAQTKQQGFYVSSGEVALLKDKSPKKPKSRRQIVPTIIPLAGSQAFNASASSSTRLGGGGDSVSSAPVAGPSGLQNGLREGTREEPIALMSDGEDGGRGGSVGGVGAGGGTALKRKPSAESQAASTGGAKKRRRGADIDSFHPDLQVVLLELKDAISKESFEQKGKFPPNLKPILAQVAIKAIQCGEYDDRFFSLMPKLFIYNKFTMTKLIKRTVYHEHQALLSQRQSELLDQLQKIAEEGFEKAQEEHQKNVTLWERRIERAKAEQTGSVEGTPAPGSTSATPLVNSNNPLPNAGSAADGGDDGEGMDVDKDGGQGIGGTGRDSHKPGKRYRLTEPMKNIIWELVVLSNESCRIENEKHQLENSTVQVSEQGTRKQLYQRIVATFPEGWMTSGQISREVSVMKKRYEAQQQEDQ